MSILPHSPNWNNKSKKVKLLCVFVYGRKVKGKVVISRMKPSQNGKTWIIIGLLPDDVLQGSQNLILNNTAYVHKYRYFENRVTIIIECVEM